MQDKQTQTGSARFLNEVEHFKKGRNNRNKHEKNNKRGKKEERELKRRKRFNARRMKGRSKAE